MQPKDMNIKLITEVIESVYALVLTMEDVFVKKALIDKKWNSGKLIMLPVQHSFIT